MIIQFIESITSDKAKPGDAKYYTCYSGTRLGGLLIHCPGCGALSVLPFRPIEGPGPSWDWDGNRVLPTLSPSIWHNVQSCGWHGFLIAGRFNSV